MTWMNSRKPLFKFAFFTVALLISMMSGFLLHAYAGSTDTHTNGTSGQGDHIGVSTDTKTIHPTVQTTAASKRFVDVCRGDTLLDIAKANLPRGGNIYSYANKIKKANGMKNSDLQEGQILILP